MKTTIQLFLGGIMVLCMTSCQTESSKPSITPTEPQVLSQTPLSEWFITASPDEPSVEPTLENSQGNPSSSSEVDLDELNDAVGYEIREPAVLPDGYILDEVTFDEPSRSICMQYHHTTAQDNVLYIAQGPTELASALQLVDGWPEYAVFQEEVNIGGAQDSLQLSGWRRPGWGCSEIAETASTPYSYALAPRYTWVVDDQLFELYSASGGCGTTGGMTSLGLLLVAEGLTGVSTHPEGELDPDCLLSIADAETLSGFDVKEPAFLPADVAFYYATYEPSPYQGVTLYFLSLQHPDMGSFFHISQYVEAPPFFMASCGELPSSSCEVLETDSLHVVYQHFNPTEQLDWSAGGFYFSLFRNAGEPGKIYKDELLQVIGNLD
jgi:hypothetical protein